MNANRSATDPAARSLPPESPRKCRVLRRSPRRERNTTPLTTSGCMRSSASLKVSSRIIGLNLTVALRLARAIARLPSSPRSISRIELLHSLQISRLLWWLWIC